MADWRVHAGRDKQNLAWSGVVDGVLCEWLQVRDKQDSLRACMEDLASLTDHYNSVRAAKELAQKELAKTKRQVEEARHDWTRKIRERRAEVGDSNGHTAQPAEAVWAASFS